MGTCFVIQPFDGGAFDKRYDDVFIPAINAAGMEPYRVDRDPSVAIPIENIEEGIRQADACLADISTMNPNVWFELGYAIAAGKDVVLVCSYDPDRRFPFDVQHRSIIIYRTESARDFKDLENKIASKLKAILVKEESIENVKDISPIADVEGLSQHEMVALVAVGANIENPGDTVSAHIIRNDMTKAGYTKIAVTLALSTLLRKSLLDHEQIEDNFGNSYTSYTITQTGMDWLLENQDKLILQHKSTQHVKGSGEDDIPF